MSAAKITGKNIVVIGIHPWYNTEIGSNCKNIALELSKNNKVLYVNMPLDRKTVLLNKKDKYVSAYLKRIKSKETLVQIQDNLWNFYPEKIIESINWIPNSSLFSFLNRINNRRFASEIKKATKQLGFDTYILFNDNDIFRSFYLKEILNPELYIYYSRDFLVAMDYWKKHGKKFEPLHIAKADIAVANSMYLTEYLSKYNKSSYYIGQGCNLELFNNDKKHPIPDDLKDIEHPVVGYVGAIVSIRIDEEIIKEIAQKRPQYNIVLVGPEDETFVKSELHSYPNVHFLGRKSIEELPAYISAFDVCINPQLINEVTIGNYPLKIDEYLSMGKPSVATSTVAMQIFKDVVYMAEKKEGYPLLIDKALKENNSDLEKERIQLAQTHNWVNSVGALYSAINAGLAKI